MKFGFDWPMTWLASCHKASENIVLQTLYEPGVWDDLDSFYGKVNLGHVHLNGKICSFMVRSQVSVLRTIGPLVFIFKKKSSVKCILKKYVLIFALFIVKVSFLAHLSRRLTRLAYRIPMVRPSFTFTKIFFSETAWRMIVKFYVELSWVGGTKVCLWDLGYMTKMVATPKYGINLSKIFISRTSFSASTSCLCYKL